MCKTLFGIVAAIGLAAAPLTPAQAITLPAPAGMIEAANALNGVQAVHYYYRPWRPHYYGYRPWRPYYYGYYRPWRPYYRPYYAYRPYWGPYYRPYYRPAYYGPRYYYGPRVYYGYRPWGWRGGYRW